MLQCLIQIPGDSNTDFSITYKGVRNLVKIELLTIHNIHTWLAKQLEMDLTARGPAYC